MCVGVSCVVREGHSGERGNENPWLWAWQRGLRCWVEGGRSHGWVSAWMGVLHLMRRQVTGLGRLEGAGWELQHVCGCGVKGEGGALPGWGLEAVSSLSVFEFFSKLPPPPASCVGQGLYPPRSPVWAPSTPTPPQVL